MRWPQITINVPDSAGKLQPYLTRIYLWLRDWKWLSLFLHHFHSDDQKTHAHSHPWQWGVSIILKGGYLESYCTGWNGKLRSRIVKPGDIVVIRPDHYHRVELLDKEKGSWSLFLAGPRVSRWGFLDLTTREYTDFETNPNAIP